MKAEVLPQHQWLMRLAGEWSYETDCASEDGSAQHKMSGRETVRSLGGIWLLAEASGQMPDGAPMSSLLTLGYDVDRGHFVGTWIGSMMTELWHYRKGWLDDAGKVLTLEAEGPTFDGSGKRATYRDIIELINDDTRTLSGNVLGDDGQWTQFMVTLYRRVR